MVFKKLYNVVFFALLCAAMLFFIIGCGDNNEKSAAKFEDAPLKPFQIELLDIAFESVSSMPVYPHIKNRSRAQEEVVQACLDLEQPKRALGYIERIENWYQNLAYAELAFYCANNNFSKKDIEHFLDIAKQIPEDIQDWQKDRVKVKIAETYAYLGDKEKANEYEKGAEPSETGKVARINAMSCTKETFDKQIDILDTLIATEEFDIVKNTLIAYVELYKNIYEDIERRELIEKKITSSWDSLPISVRIELLIELADCCLSCDNKTESLRFINSAKSLMDSVTWDARFLIPLMARIAKVQYLSGQKEAAISEIQKSLNIYENNLPKIVNINKAGVLRPIAEASIVFGDRDLTLDIYRKAIEAGFENPNSRPRAEDLSATCSSMALNNFEPGADLLARIKEIQNSLGDPW